MSSGGPEPDPGRVERDRPGEPDARAAGPRDPAGGPAGFSDVIQEVVSLVEAATAYLADLLRLERFRLEREAKGYLRRLLFILAGGGIALIGALLISLAAAAWISVRTGSAAAGLGVVGAFYLLIGIGLALAGFGRTRSGDGGDGADGDGDV